MTGKKFFELPYPPSVNHYWGQYAIKKRIIMFVGKKGIAYKQKVKDLYPNPVTFQTRLRIEIYAFMPDKRVRDIDNLSKCLLDSLVHAKIILDDSLVDELYIKRERVIKGGKLDVYIEELNNE